MQNKDPIFKDYRHYLNMDKFTFEYAKSQVVQYERIGFQTAQIMTHIDVIPYHLFVKDDCPYCMELEVYLKSYVFRRMYPEMNKGLADLAEKEESISLWNLRTHWERLNFGQKKSHKVVIPPTP